MKNFNLNKIGKSLSFFKKSKVKKNLFNPYRDWNILIYTFFFLLLCLFAFSLYLLFQIKNDKFFQVEKIQKSNEVMVNEKLLTEIIGEFDEKNKKLEELKTNSEKLSDPSL